MFFNKLCQGGDLLTAAGFSRNEGLPGGYGKNLTQTWVFVTDAHLREIDRALEEVYRYPLYPTATDALNRQIRAGIDDHRLAELVRNLREDGRLCAIDEQESQREPKILCTLGLA